jgi:hypothetical protein
MLFTEPNTEPQPLKRIVFMADYAEHARAALRNALRLAAAESCERFYVVRVYTTFDQARAALRTTAPKAADPSARTLEEEEAALEEFILSAGQTVVPIEARCIRGNTGFAAMDFVNSVEADLLVVPLENDEARTGEVPAQIAWVTDVIPCNLWIMR